MARAEKKVFAFNAGEFSPLLAGRVDLPQSERACSRLRNMVVDPFGAATRRQGMQMIAAAKAQYGNRLQVCPIGTSGPSITENTLYRDSQDEADEDAEALLNCVPDATNFTGAFNNTVFAIGIQADGKVVAGGNFTQANGIASQRVARLTTLGANDAVLASGANIFVSCLGIQSTGKIVVGGRFTTFGGGSHLGVARLNADFTIDSGFVADLAGLSAQLNGLIVQADDKIIIFGEFTSVNATTRNYIARLNSDGTLDSGYNPNANNIIFGGCRDLSTGVFLVGGFTTIAGGAHAGIVRLDSTGANVAGFSCSLNAEAYGVGVQSDGKVIIAGLFTQINATGRSFLGRVSSAGVLDGGFTPSPGAAVDRVAVQSDDKFITSSGHDFAFLRYLSTGAVDSGYVVTLGAFEYVLAIAFDSMGRAVIGGPFLTINGVSHPYIARLSTTGILA